MYVKQTPYDRLRGPGYTITGDCKMQTPTKDQSHQSMMIDERFLHASRYGAEKEAIIKIPEIDILYITVNITVFLVAKAL
jgi:hypothetical protein